MWCLQQWGLNLSFSEATKGKGNACIMLGLFGLLWPETHKEVSHAWHWGFCSILWLLGRSVTSLKKKYTNMHTWTHTLPLKLPIPLSPPPEYWDCRCVQFRLGSPHATTHVCVYISEEKCWSRLSLLPLWVMTPECFQAWWQAPGASHIFGFWDQVLHEICASLELTMYPGLLWIL